MTGIMLPKRLTRKTKISWFVPATLERKLYRLVSTSVTGAFSLVLGCRNRSLGGIKRDYFQKSSVRTVSALDPRISSGPTSPLLHLGLFLGLLLSHSGFTGRAAMIIPCLIALRTKEKQ